MPRGDVKATTRHVVQIDQRDQHQQRTEQRVEEKLEGCVDLVRTAPDTNDEIHRDQRGLEEHIEQHAVECREDTDHQSRQDQEGPHVLVHTLGDRLPGSNHHDHRDECRQRHEPERDSIHPEVVENIETLDPGSLLDKLHGGSSQLETLIERQGHGKPRQRTDEGKPAHGTSMLVTAKGQQQNTERDGRPDSKTQQTHFCSSPTC